MQEQTVSYVPSLRRGPAYSDIGHPLLAFSNEADLLATTQRRIGSHIRTQVNASVAHTSLNRRHHRT